MEEAAAAWGWSLSTPEVVSTTDTVTPKCVGLLPVGGALPSVWSDRTRVEEVGGDWRVLLPLDDSKEAVVFRTLSLSVTVYCPSGLQGVGHQSTSE